MTSSMTNKTRPRIACLTAIGHTDNLMKLIGYTLSTGAMSLVDTALSLALASVLVFDTEMQRSLPAVDSLYSHWAGGRQM